MPRLRMLVAVGATAFGGTLLALGAAAAPHSSRADLPRHALAACMSRKMAASRAISYNQAGAECRAQLQTRHPADRDATVARR